MFFVDVYKDFKGFSSKNSRILSSVYILILLYPLFILSVRDWSSGIYSLLCLIAIGYLFKKDGRSVPREVKIYSWIIFLFFISILISSTLNNWTENSYYRLGAEAKILVFIPFFLLVAKNTQLIKWFVYSIPLAGIVLGGHGIIEVLIFSEPYSNTAYGKIITGDIAGLLVGLSAVIFFYTNDEVLKKICIAAFILAAITCVLSTSRNGWLVLAANISFMLLLSFRKNKKLLLLFMIIPIVGFVIANTMIDSKVGLNAAVNQFEEYADVNQRKKINLTSSSIGFRLEQWRVAILAFPDKPVFGAGPGNSGLVINTYIKKGIADPDLYHSGASTDMVHVHNQFLDTLLVQGIVGLLLLLLILFYPVWVFIKFYKNNELYANMGFVLIISYVISSLTEMPFVSDNYLSIFFMFMAVFFSNVIDSKREI